MRRNKKIIFLIIVMLMHLSEVVRADLIEIPASSAGCGYQYLQRGCSPQEAFCALMGVDIEKGRIRNDGKLNTCYSRPPAFMNTCPTDTKLYGCKQWDNLLFYSECGEVGYNHWMREGKSIEMIPQCYFGEYSNNGSDCLNAGRGSVITYGPNSHVDGICYEGHLEASRIKFLCKDAKAWGISPRPTCINFQTGLPEYTGIENPCSVFGPAHPVSLEIEKRNLAKFKNKPPAPSNCTNGPTQSGPVVSNCDNKIPSLFSPKKQMSVPSVSVESVGGAGAGPGRGPSVSVKGNNKGGGGGPGGPGGGSGIRGALALGAIAVGANYAAREGYCGKAVQSSVLKTDQDKAERIEYYKCEIMNEEKPWYWQLFLGGAWTEEVGATYSTQ